MSVAFKDIVAVTGSPGLYQIVKADDRAIVVESLDGRKKRQLIKGNMVVSKLTDVSIYTKTDSEPLVTIFKSIHEQFGSELPVEKKSSKNELMGFLGKVLPDFDEERVYPSNVKKLISWYHIMLGLGVEFVVEDEEEKEEGEEAAANEETTEAAAEAEETTPTEEE
ncbi:MAG: DUF5606 domain-containing protein [Bacteroidota bacterium]